MKGEVFCMARTATRTANVYTRVDPETKEQAETILNQLGIPMSNAIGMFLKQIVIHRGIPFEMKLPDTAPIAAGSLTKEQLDAELQKGMDDIVSGRVLSADEVEAEMRSLYSGRDIRRQLEDTKEW
jgi:addiction module RelB/DinJ family antitoxin